MEVRQLVRRVLGPWNLDEVLMVFRVIGGKPGTMLDVGAHHGSALSPFLNRGWTVHAFEPDPANREILSSRCPGAVIDSRAVSEVDGDEVALFTSDVSTGISTLSPFHATHTPTATVQTVRLDTYLRERAVDQVDFLKTDIEGFDLFALRTFPWATHHPKAVVCEFEDHKTLRLGHDVHESAQYLERQGYSVLVSEWEPIARYGTRHRWRRFARYPADVAADSWGNLIAVEPPLLEPLERAGQSAVRRLRTRQWVDRLRRSD
ncbi:FkbM family methyltransferase [Mycolicibacterium pulveris]|uniref:FkbM family methyltransferase n=1 Tax=Mycolicibacterium pulveris TaxID=36813 RepID=UPI003CF569A5